MIRLKILYVTACTCGRVCGAYLDRMKAVHNGRGVPVIVNTFDLRNAVKHGSNPRASIGDRNTLDYVIRYSLAAPLYRNWEVDPKLTIGSPLGLNPWKTRTPPDQVVPFPNPKNERQEAPER